MLGWLGQVKLARLGLLCQDSQVGEFKLLWFVEVRFGDVRMVRLGWLGKVGKFGGLS